MLARLQSHIFKLINTFVKLSLRVAFLLICSASGAALASDVEVRLERSIADYKERRDKAATELRIHDFFASLSAVYEGDILFSKGIYKDPFAPFYHAAIISFPTTGGLVKKNDYYLLTILKNTQYRADTEWGGCVAPDLFVNPKDTDDYGALGSVLQAYKVAAEFQKFEKKETGLSMPPNYMEQLQARIKSVEDFITIHAKSSPGTCLDLKQLLSSFDNREDLMAKIKARPDFVSGPCPFFNDPFGHLALPPKQEAIWAEEEEIINLDTPLGTKYINAYMRNIPINYTRAPHEMTVEDFEKVKIHFIKAGHAYFSGDFYFSKKMYAKAFEEYDLAVKNIPSFINLSRRAEAKLMRLLNQVPSTEHTHVKEQLLEIIGEYKAALVVYKFEMCEELISIPLMEMAKQGSKINCLEKIAASNVQPADFTACLRDDRPIYRRCIELVNHPRWSCPGAEI